MATKSVASKSLSEMTASERLAFYRAANKAGKPASQSDFSITETAAKLAADVSVVPTNFVAAFKYHRSQALGE